MRDTLHQQAYETETVSFGWGYLILGILFVIAAFLAFINPLGNLETLAFAFAFLAILEGAWMLANYSGRALVIVGGIVNILIGIFFLANIYLAALALPYVFAIWFIISAMFRLFNAGSARTLGYGYFALSIILNIIGLILGIVLLFMPSTAAIVLSILVGFYLLLAGIECIAWAFARRGII